MTDEMIEKFVYLVRKMRECQRRYFRSRSHMAMMESKQFEAEVDKIIIIIDHQPQPELPLN